MPIKQRILAFFAESHENGHFEMHFVSSYKKFAI